MTSVLNGVILADVPSVLCKEQPLSTLFQGEGLGWRLARALPHLSSIMRSYESRQWSRISVLQVGDTAAQRG